MENSFGLEDREDFRIDPRVWLQTLLAIAGDKDRKREAIQRIARETGCPPEKIDVIFATTINILMNQTRSN
jgi:N-glycosylase/DNA lyase